MNVDPRTLKVNFIFKYRGYDGAKPLRLGVKKIEVAQPSGRLNYILYDIESGSGVGSTSEVRNFYKYNSI
jgi:hypothetical protein